MIPIIAIIILVIFIIIYVDLSSSNYTDKPHIKKPSCKVGGNPASNAIALAALNAATGKEHFMNSRPALTTTSTLSNESIFGEIKINDSQMDFVNRYMENEPEDKTDTKTDVQSISAHNEEYLHFPGNVASRHQQTINPSVIIRKHNIDNNNLAKSMVFAMNSDNMDFIDLLTKKMFKDRLDTYLNPFNKLSSGQDKYYYSLNILLTYLDYKDKILTMKESGKYEKNDELQDYEDVILDIKGNHYISKLIYLNCNNNKIKTIPKYINLIELDCNNNMINELPLMLKLTDLDCSYNNISNLPCYPNLIYLNCISTNITDISFLKHLKCINNILKYN